MFCKLEGEVEEWEVAVGKPGNGMSEQRPAIIAPSEGRHCFKNRAFLTPTQTAFANDHGMDELLLSLNGLRYGTLNTKKVRKKSVNCN